MNPNQTQANRIMRAYVLLRRNGKRVSLELIAREWINRYAAQWRHNFERRISGH